ncbi:protease inhibitor I42 family protein [Clostridium neuense]
MYYPYNMSNFHRIKRTYDTLLTDSGTNIMKIGENAWVILDDNPSTGYSWRVVTDSSGIYKVIKSFYLPTNTGSVGSPGKSIWIIRAVDTGRGSITFKYSRAYSTDSNDKEIRYEINVI